MNDTQKTLSITLMLLLDKHGAAYLLEKLSEECEAAALPYQNAKTREDHDAWQAWCEIALALQGVSDAAKLRGI